MEQSRIYVLRVPNWRSQEKVWNMHLNIFCNESAVCEEKWMENNNEKSLDLNRIVEQKYGSLTVETVLQSSCRVFEMRKMQLLKNSDMSG